MAIDTNTNITNPVRTDASGTVIPVDKVEHVDASGNVTIVYERVVDADGTSGYVLTNTGSVIDGGSQNNYGSYTSFSPTSVNDPSQCNSQTVTVTQSRYRTHSITNFADYRYDTYTCTVLTPPTGNGIQPDCVNPSGVVSSTYQDQVFVNSTTTTTQPNDYDYRTASVTNTAYIPPTTVFVRDTSIPLSGGVFTQTDPGTCAPVDESIGCGTSNAFCTVSSTRTPYGNKTAVMQTGVYRTTDCLNNVSDSGQVTIQYSPAITDGSAQGTPVACTITYPNPDLVSCETGTSQGFGSQELCNGTIVSGVQTACFKTGQPGVNYTGTSCS